MINQKNGKSEDKSPKIENVTYTYFSISIQIDKCTWHFRGKYFYFQGRKTLFGLGETFFLGCTI